MQERLGPAVSNKEFEGLSLNDCDDEVIFVQVMPSDSFAASERRLQLAPVFLE